MMTETKVASFMGAFKRAVLVNGKSLSHAAVIGTMQAEGLTECSADRLDVLSQQYIAELDHRGISVEDVLEVDSLDGVLP